MCCVCCPHKTGNCPRQGHHVGGKRGLRGRWRNLAGLQCLHTQSFKADRGRLWEMCVLGAGGSEVPSEKCLGRREGGSLHLEALSLPPTGLDPRAEGAGRIRGRLCAKLPADHVLAHCVCASPVPKASPNYRTRHHVSLTNRPLSGSSQTHAHGITPLLHSSESDDAHLWAGHRSGSCPVGGGIEGGTLHGSAGHTGCCL